MFLLSLCFLCCSPPPYQKQSCPRFIIFIGSKSWRNCCSIINSSGAFPGIRNSRHALAFYFLQRSTHSFSDAAVANPMTFILTLRKWGGTHRSMKETVATGNPEHDAKHFCIHSPSENFQIHVNDRSCRLALVVTSACF